MDLVWEEDKGCGYHANWCRCWARVMGISNMGIVLADWGESPPLAIKLVE